MSYLNETYLGETPQAPMALPEELIKSLSAQAQQPGEFPIPTDHVRLPGGIVMKRSTAVILVTLIALAVFLYFSKKKKEKSVE